MNREKRIDPFAPHSIGKLHLKNRFALAPMTRISASIDGIPSEKMLQYYKSFAEGGFGLIITEGTYIDDKYSQTYQYQPGIVFEKHIEGWKKIQEAIHESGAKAIMQIQHSGALSQGNYYSTKTIAPSAIKPLGKQLEFYHGKGEYQTPSEATLSEIEQIKSAFVKAAINAQKAGFDGVEIHGANGYFLDQFLSSYTNLRTDQYGGSFENRVRLLTEVIKDVRENVKPEFIVGIRISQGKVNDYHHKWEGINEAEIIFNELTGAGIDYLHITEFNAALPAFNQKQPDDERVPSLALLAKKITGLPILSNGSIDSIESVNHMLNSEESDFVTIGKAALANHNFPILLKNRQETQQFDSEKILRPFADLKDFEYSNN
ncbi:NADH:flavin oxidoreductase [Flavobacterium anhuiense]|uniref:NADH:flavin oxidoreductase n=1 Tax=Flavobacterium anhuiense TaxID=459526 RepID=UPI003D95464D